MVHSTGTGMLEIFDDEWYRQLAWRSRGEYLAKQPFPHAMFDGFLSSRTAETLALNYPDNRNVGWTIHSNEHADRKFLGDVTAMGPPMRSFAAAISSRSFLLFLEALTGIKHLIPDPYFIGGGAMTAGPGDKLDMHVDFNWHYGLHLHRRCNALFYLTPDWKPEWGGQLALGEQAEAQYFPDFNRCIIFSTTENSWHGQPNPIASPEGVLRRVFSAFYYTSATPAEAADPHLTKYQMETPYTAKPLKDYQIESD